MNLARPWVFICLAGVLSGCGQKGPLVMPDAQKHKRSIPAPPTTPAKPAGADGAAAPAAPGPATSPTPPAQPSASAPTDSPAHP